MGPTRTASRTAFVILEYCGGAQTDALHARLSNWNPKERIRVLDNASPENHAACITHRNEINSYIGGGIRDCLALSEGLGADYLFFSVNDVEILDPLIIADFEAVMNADPLVALVSTALSPDSQQAERFPWLVRQEGSGIRRVRVADPLCCLIRLDFIRSFGGLPPSKGGWGYSSEMAYHAREQGMKIYVNDACAVRHLRAREHLVGPTGEHIDKRVESRRVYWRRYGPAAETVRGVFADPDFDENAAIALPATVDA